MITSPDTLVSENIHEKCILQNTLSASPFFTFLSIDLNGQIMLSDILIYPANASSVFYLRCGWSLLLLAALTGFLLFFKKLTAERRYLAANSIHLGLQAIIIFLFLIGFKTA